MIHYSTANRPIRLVLLTKRPATGEEWLVLGRKIVKKKLVVLLGKCLTQRWMTGLEAVVDRRYIELSSHHSFTCLQCLQYRRNVMNQ